MNKTCIKCKETFDYEPRIKDTCVVCGMMIIFGIKENEIKDE